MDEQNVMHSQSGILLSLKRKEIPIPVTTWNNFEDIMLSETSQSPKDKYHIILLITGT